MSIQTSVEVHRILRRAFPGLKKDDLAEFARLARLREYPQGVILCAEGAFENTFYVVDEGKVEVSKAVDEMERRILKEIGPGGFFGEMALLHDAPRGATVRTLARTRVIEVDKDDFESILSTSTSMALTIVREVSARLRENDEVAISELREKAAELSSAYQRLAEQESARTEFLSILAHELRTPLTAASGFLQVMRSGMLEGDTLHSAVQTVSANVQRVISLVNDLLFLQEMDIILLEFERLDLGAVLASSVEKMRAHADSNVVAIDLKMGKNLPQVFGDVDSLRRALEAILDNAIKFSPDGGQVRVGLERVGDRVRLEVEDQGIGIPDEALNRVFDRFFRIEHQGDHLFGGLGLGLSIAKEVVQRHGGMIEAQRGIDKGTRIRIWLPAGTERRRNLSRKP